MGEWVTKPLSQLASFQKGRKVETSEHPREGFAPYLGASAISGTIEEYADARFGVAAAAGDVLMLWDGERSGLVGKAQNGVISSTVARLSGKGEIEGNFLYYALDEKFDWIQNHRTGTGVPHVPKDLGHILSISFPKDKNEQRRIAEILSTLDEAIEQTEALIAKYQQIKAGLMPDLFTRGVTPGGHLRPTRTQSPHLYKESPLGWIPKEWEVEVLGKHIGRIDSGWSPNCAAEPAGPDEWGVLKTTAVMWDGYNPSENKRLPEDFKPMKSIETRQGDLLITRKGPVDRVGVVVYVDETPPRLMFPTQFLERHWLRRSALVLRF